MVARKINIRKKKHGTKKKKIVKIKSDNPNGREDFEWLLGEMSKPIMQPASK
jgi:hypothetical protein